MSSIEDSSSSSILGLTRRPARPVAKKSRAQVNKFNQTIERNKDFMTESILIIQCAVRSWIARKEVKKRRKSAGFRTKVANELLETERTYVRGLSQIVKLVELPAVQKKLLSPDDERTIFSTLSTILNCNEKVLELLEQRMSRWEAASTSVGDIFLQFSEFLKASLFSYTATYNEAITKLSEIMQKKGDFTAFVKDVFAKNKMLYRDIPMYLITPVQRIPRYKLLLADILKNTWESHPDFVNLSNAVDKIVGIADYINQKVSLAENMSKVLSAQNNLVGKFNSFVDSHRRFVREGELKQVIWCEDKKAMKKRYCILFNDLLVVARVRKGKSSGTFKHEYLLKLSFRNFTITDNIDTNDVKDSFLLNAQAEKERITFSAASPDEKKSWLDDLYQVVKEYSDKESATEKHREHRSQQRAEQAKAILGEKYTAMRLSSADTASSTPSRYDSLRRHKQEALNSAANSGSTPSVPSSGAVPRDPDTMSKIAANSFKKMTPQERLQLLKEAQENLDKLLQQEKARIDSTKAQIKDNFGSLTSGARMSYKEMKKQRRESHKVTIDDKFMARLENSVPGFGTLQTPTPADTP